MVDQMLAVAGSERVNDKAEVDNDYGGTSECTGLTISSENGHLKVVELLIGAKADANKCDEVDIL